MINLLGALNCFTYLGMVFSFESNSGKKKKKNDDCSQGVHWKWNMAPGFGGWGSREKGEMSRALKIHRCMRVPRKHPRQMWVPHCQYSRQEIRAAVPSTITRNETKGSRDHVAYIPACPAERIILCWCLCWAAARTGTLWLKPRGMCS